MAAAFSRQLYKVFGCIFVIPDLVDFQHMMLVSYFCLSLLLSVSHVKTVHVVFCQYMIQ